MSELALTLLRLGLLLALWLFVFGVISTLRRDLTQDARPARPRSPAPARARARGAHIVVTFADGSTRRIDLAGDHVTFGRGEDNTVVLDDDYTSTHHARIERRDRVWFIEDCGSTNGTWVDRRRISGATPLSEGMRVRIGRTDVAVGA